MRIEESNEVRPLLEEGVDVHTPTVASTRPRHGRYSAPMTLEKFVYITESHHHVLPAWTDLRRQSDRAPRLLTFDHHKDTRSAFIAYSTRQPRAEHRPWEAITTERLRTIDFRSDESIKAAVADLAWDEHIDAAVRLDVLDIAFVAAYDEVGHIESNEQLALDAKRTLGGTEMRDGKLFVTLPGPPTIASPPFTYRIPASRIVTLPHALLPEELPEDQAYRAYFDAALESQFLKQRLELIHEITRTSGEPGLFDRLFILDFDLDYFNTKQAIAPADTSMLDDLIPRAAFITIARESSCVNSCQVKGEGLDSDFLEQELLKHIARATEAAGQTMVVRRIE